MSYHGLIRGAHSLSGSRYASSLSECSDLKYSASSPTSSVAGGSEMSSFPLQWEEPWLFTSAIV